MEKNVTIQGSKLSRISLLASRPRSKITVVAIVLAVFPVLLTAAEDNIEGGIGSGFELSAAYFGELATHPGGIVAVKYSVVDGDWIDILVGPAIGLYVHPRNHIGLFLDAEAEMFLTAPFGLFVSLGVSAGYYHTLLAAEVYDRDTGGTVSSAIDWGRPHAKSGVSLGLGWDLEKGAAIPLRFFTRVDVFAQYPFNNDLLPHAAIQLGFAHRIGGSK